MYLYGFSSVFQGGKSFPFPSDLFSSPLSQSIFIYKWPHLSVALTEDQALYRQPHTYKL